mmetsp:Transcript_8116/g.8051  ORF Transcript_8116/g.8051 Transcript_8116/m.8051 type:complete len:321 (-) Transcript_8116:1207-2169(-)
MINSIETSTENSSFQPKSILKNSKSVPTLHTRTTPSDRKSSHPKKKVSSFVKNISILWNLLRLKVRSLSEEVFTTDEGVDDLFFDIDSDDPLERLARNNRGYASTEERFLKEFKKYKTLDKMHEEYLQKNQSMHAEVKSSTTAVSDVQTKGLSLQDIIRQISDTTNSSKTPCNDSDEEDEEVDESLKLATYHDVDICKMREDLALQLKQIASSESIPDTSKSSLRETGNQINLGETLWEYRRSKWLATTSEGELSAKEHLRQLSIAHIPKNSYVRIYNNLVDKGRLLKNDKRINLSDLIKIINAGWISEERWERAAKGLA